MQCGTDTDPDRETYTFCANCGSINCTTHAKTERLEGTPICTGCAVTERFAFKTKYFYHEDNLEAFREEYAAMPIYRKTLENKPFTVVGVLTTIILLGSLLVYSGVI